MDSLNQAIEDLCTSKPEAAVWLGGDINLPDINWATDEIVGHQYTKSMSPSS